MASVAKRPDGMWRARYYDGEGKQHARHFARKIDAERWVNEQQNKVNKGEWTAPELGRITIAEWAPVWLASKKGLKTRSSGSYDSLWRTLVEPRWGKVRLDRVTYAETVNWVAEMTGRGLSPSRIGQALLCLKQLLDLAVLDGRLSRNVVKPVKAPRPRKGEPRYLTHDEVAALADSCGEHGHQYKMLILTASYCGLRWGELRALTVRRVDLMRRKVQVVENMPDHGGGVELPKNHKRRVVSLPRFLVADLTTLMAGKAQTDLVFINAAGQVLDNSNFRRNVFTPAARDLGLLPLTPHDLRDTAASLAVSAGANVKVVQRMLGHASAAMTLDIYSGLFENDMDEVADRMDQAAKASQAARCPRSSVTVLGPLGVPATGTDNDAR